MYRTLGSHWSHCGRHINKGRQEEVQEEQPSEDKHRTQCLCEPARLLQIVLLCASFQLGGSASKGMIGGTCWIVQQELSKPPQLRADPETSRSKLQLCYWDTIRDLIKEISSIEQGTNFVC